MTEHLPTRDVVLAGPLVVAHAASLQAQLLEAFDSAQAIHVDFSAATDLDVSFLQLLVAAKKSAVAEGKTLTMSAPWMMSLQIERCGLKSAALPNFHGARA